MQAGAHAAGSAVPFEAEWLARLIPDVNDHTSAARLIRRLLHPDPARRPTVRQALDDDFLQPQLECLFAFTAGLSARALFLAVRKVYMLECAHDAQ